MVNYDLKKWIDHTFELQYNAPRMRDKNWEIIPYIRAMRFWSKKLKLYVDLRRNQNHPNYYYICMNDIKKGYLYYNKKLQKFTQTPNFEKNHWGSWDDLFNLDLDLDLDKEIDKRMIFKQDCYG